MAGLLVSQPSWMKTTLQNTSHLIIPIVIIVIGSHAYTHLTHLTLWDRQLLWGDCGGCKDWKEIHWHLENEDFALIIYPDNRKFMFNCIDADLLFCYSHRRRAERIPKRRARRLPRRRKDQEAKPRRRQVTSLEIYTSSLNNPQVYFPWEITTTDEPIVWPITTHSGITLPVH